MAFPTISTGDTQSGTVTGNSSSWSGTYPTNLANGDLILLFVGADGGGTISSLPAGWVFSTATNGSAVSAGWAKKKSDGTETGSFTIGLAAAEQGCWTTLRIPASEWEGTLGTTFDNLATAGSVVRSFVNTGTSANPDSDSVNPGQWDIEDTLWLSVGASDRQATYTNFPATFPLYQTAAESGGSNGATLGYCGRESSSASQDPAPMTTDASEEWVAVTIGIRPAGVTVVTGSGGLAFPFAAAGSGIAITPVTASGGLAFGFSTAGLGAETLEGAGGVAFPFSTSGAASEVFEGSGGTSFPFSLAAAGELSLAGAAALAFPFSVSASGTVEADDSVVASGGLVFGFAAAGAAEELLAGSGALSFSFSAAGLAEELLAASGGLAFSFSTAVSGEERLAGAGGLAFGFSSSGAGDHEAPSTPVGAGALVFGFNSGGVAVETLSGSGGLELEFSVIGSGLTYQPVEGVGDLSFGMSVQGEIDLPIVSVPGDVLNLLKRNRSRWPWNRGGFPRR